MYSAAVMLKYILLPQPYFEAFHKSFHNVTQIFREQYSHTWLLGRPTQFCNPVITVFHNTGYELDKAANNMFPNDKA